MDDYGGKICYCIEPGTPAANGNEFTQKDESFWDNYPSQYNKTIDADIIKLMVGRILQYGFTGDVELTWVSQNPDGAKKIAQAAATQALIWETIVGERDENFNHVDPGSKSPVLSMFEKIILCDPLFFPITMILYQAFRNIPNCRVFVNAVQARRRKLSLNGTALSI